MKAGRDRAAYSRRKQKGMNAMKIETAQQVFRLAAYCLQYPDEQWMSSLAEIREAAQEMEIVGEASSYREHFLRFLQAVEQADGSDWQEQYVRTFDFGKHTNLYLTYVGHGEERERGPALLEIKKRYEHAGFLMVDGELPDYLPLMLEFASVAPWDTALELLQAHGDTIAGIHNELAKINSPYGLMMEAVLDAVRDVAGDVTGDAAGDTARGGARI